MTVAEFAENMKEEEEEITVYDVDYDTEFYITSGDPITEWEESIHDIASCFEVTEIIDDTTIECNASAVIEKAIENGYLDEEAEIDDIMNDLNEIMSGYTTDEWIKNFAENLKRSVEEI